MSHQSNPSQGNREAAAVQGLAGAFPVMKRAVGIIAVLALAGCGSSTQRATEAAAQGQQLLDAGQYAQAAERLSYAARQRDDLPGLWLLLGRARSALRDAPGAFAAYRNALDQDSGSREALLALSQLSLSAGKNAEAEDYADRLLLLSPGLADALIIKGFAALGADHVADAAASADEVLKADASNELALTIKSMIAYRAGDFVAAAEYLRVPMERNTRSPDVLRQLRRIFRQTADVRNLVKTTARIAELNPSDDDAQLDYARSLYITGDVERATKVLGKFGARGNSVLRARVVAMWMDAAVSLERLAPLSALREQPWLQLAFADYCSRSGRADLALRQLRFGEGEAVIGTADGRGVLSAALLASGKAPEADAAATRALAIDSRQPLALAVRARLALDRRDVDGALRMARILVADNPSFGTGYRLLSDVYRVQGDMILADKAMMDASNSASTSVEQLKYSINYFVGRSKLDQASSLVKMFVSRNPTSRLAWQLRDSVCKRQNDLPCQAIAAEFLRRLNGLKIDYNIKLENSDGSAEGELLAGNAYRDSIRRISGAGIRSVGFAGDARAAA